MDTTEAKLSFAIILTPDCDLLQDFKERQAGRESKLFNLLLFGVEEAQQTKDRIRYGRQEWKQVQQNGLEQFYYLKRIASKDDLLSEGLPDLVIDFKRYFTLPPVELYRQCTLPHDIRTCRRCRLSDLWREDLQRRAMSYMQRVGLPDSSDEQ